MNANINLASRPFTNRALPWILTVVILFVSLVALVLVVQLTTTANRRAAQLEAEVNLLKQKEQSLVSAAESVKAALTPEQRLNLRAAHELVDRKGFSWSRLLADLESALPDNIRVSRIAVRGVANEGDRTIAQLELVVFSKSSTTVTDMINAMDREGVFHADIKNQDLQKGRGESGTEYELDVVYRPRAGAASESVAEVRQTKSNEVPR